MKRLLIVFCMFVSAALVFAEVDFTKMLRDIDSVADFGGKDFSCTWKIISEKPNEKPSETQIQIYRRDQNDQLVYVMLKPKANKGQGFLKVDDNMWIYDPGSGKFNHSTFKEAVGGSDANNSDIKKSSLADDYTIESSKEGKLGKFEVYILTLKAKTNEVTYASIVLTILKDKPLVLREEDIAFSGKPSRLVNYPPPYQQVGNKFIPSKILMEDLANPGEKSTVFIENVSIAKLDDSTFTKAFLKNSAK